MTFVIRPFKIDVRIDLFYCEYMALIQNLSFEILNQFRFTVLTNSSLFTGEACAEIVVIGSDSEV
jgi:hypothetical protein